MQLNEKNILVYGAGKSGISSVKLLINQSCNIVLFDNNKEYKINDKIINQYSKIKLITGELKNEDLEHIDLVVISPGVPTDTPDIIMVKSKNIIIWSEIELAYHFSKGKIIGITGTNGKTTTTSLVGEIIKKYNDNLYVVGNIGNPFTDIALDTNDDTVIVAELSSFQLETIIEFAPNISAILNISPDHLNRHHTMEEYIKVKKNIYRKQSFNDYCILNYDDIEVRKNENEIKAKIIYFSKKEELGNGVYLIKDKIIYSKSNNKTEICNVNELKIIGMHNYENIMAAISITIALNIPLEIIKKAILEFKAVEHRIEYIDTIKGVRYYNDSKGTNPDASQKAVEAMTGPTILIAGGYDKDAAYEGWINSFNGRVKYLVLLGQTKDKIAEQAIKQGYTNIIKVKTLNEAVNISAEKASEGDSVLLSPACASWGMFKDYEERGKLFKQYVNGLLE
ncbi:MAG TPA: UDP-N-acetylmuramoyl-L-alanine--D-glutamate ligase [Clostridiales bacterium]|nr:UDP-N-acetylmuramoyl-L-alanine--D-glutamate ligase [Clostridiales bacterium]